MYGFIPKNILRDFKGKMHSVGRLDFNSQGLILLTNNTKIKFFLEKPSSKIKIYKIKKDMGWCDDPNSRHYNKLIKIKKNLKSSYEKLYRKDSKYDLLILIKYNYKKVRKNKGSAIFLHLTKDYSATKGCIAIKKKDFLILNKLINKKTRIKIT